MIRDEQIRQVAYHNWERAGRPSGRDLEFWTDAEQSLIGRGQTEVLGFRERLSRNFKSLDAWTRPYFEHPALKHPLVYGLILMVIGGYLLKSWEQDRANRIATRSRADELQRIEDAKTAERERAIRDLKREKAVEFVHDVAPDINRMVSSLYGWVRAPRDTKALEEHEIASRNLYYRRFSVRMKSESYLKPIGLDFYEDYRRLMIESSNTRYTLKAVPKACLSEVAETLSSQACELFTAWKAEDPDLILEEEDDNNPGLQESLKEWAKYSETLDDDEAVRTLYMKVIALANLYYKRSHFILSRGLSTSLKN